MKPYLSLLLAVMLVVPLSACTGDATSIADYPPVADSQSSDAELSTDPTVQTALRMVRDMMAWDYPAMTVAQFAEDIQTLCADAGGSIYDVMAVAYADYKNFDKDLDRFIRTTLAYTGQEIMNQPVHMGVVVYITADGLSAADMQRMADDMEPPEYYAFMEALEGDATVHANVNYLVRFEATNPETLTVADRDARIGHVCKDIEAFITALPIDDFVLASPDLVERTQVQMAELSDRYSDSALKITASLVNIYVADQL